MPTKEEHLQQAQRNDAFLASFDIATSNFLDWALTAAFYTALHYLRGLMAHLHYTAISNYGDIDRGFERLAPLKQRPDLYDAYRTLKDDSRAARYNMWRPSPAELIDLRDNELRLIREFIVANT